MARATRVPTVAVLCWEDQLDQVAGRSGYLDEDTFYSAASVAAARAGAGAALVITDALLERRADFGLVACFPLSCFTPPCS